MNSSSSIALRRVSDGMQLLSEQVSVSSLTVPVRHGQLGVPLSRLDDVADPGHLVRDGGVLRYAPGAPDGKGGQIAAHLRDVGGQGQSLGVPSGGGQFMNALQGVGAVASVANLAVSAVGFYMMNQKLNQLQSEMEGLRNDVQNLSDQVSSGFQRVEKRLVNIEHLAGNLVEGQRKIRRAQEHINEQFQVDRIGKLRGTIETLQELEEKTESPSRSRITRRRDLLKDLRGSFEEAINRYCRGDEEVTSPKFVSTVGYYQYWGLALALEARLLRMAEEPSTAADLIRSRLKTWYMSAAQDTVAELIDENPGKLLAGAFQNKIATPQYLSILEFRRGAEFEESEVELVLEEADEDQREVFGRTPGERADRLREFTTGRPSPAEQEYSRAAQAYRLRELGRRLDTMALEYELCGENSLEAEEWERADLADEDSGEIHAIPVDS